MHRKRLSLALAATVVITTSSLHAQTPEKSTPKRSTAEKAGVRSPARAALLESANGWIYLKGKWVHPQGYEFVNRQVFRTTAKAGGIQPKAPGKLAL